MQRLTRALSTTRGLNMWSSQHQAPTPAKLLKTNDNWVKSHDPARFVESAKGQNPSIFWLGCCDSRVPAELITGAVPGDLFVHRNIANTFNQRDNSALAALAYAVNALGVSHVVVCGHYNCGGVQAALASAKERGPVPATEEYDEGSAAIQKWLTPIRSLAVAGLRTAKSDSEGNTTSDPAASDPDSIVSLRRLVEQNVCAQVSNVAGSTVVQSAWRAGKPITVHGWVYDLATGKLKDLKVSEGTDVQS